MNNIHRITIPLAGNPLKELNSYVITGQRNLLIDTGFRTEACMAAMTRQLEALGVDLGKTDIFLTHLHSDHTGLSVDLHREGCKIFVSRTDGEKMAGYSDGSSRPRSNSFYISHGFPEDLIKILRTKNPAFNMAPPSFDGHTYFEDGAVFNYGGLELEAIATPGHTPGHMCLYCRDEKLLFSGDHVLFDITPNITSWFGFPNSLGSYLDSLDHIGTLDVETTLPGHRATGDIYKRIDELKAHHKYRINETLSIVRQNPGANAYDIAAAMTWKIRCKSWEDFPVAQKWFAVGEAIAHLDWLEANGLVVKTEENSRFSYSPV